MKNLHYSMSNDINIPIVSELDKEIDRTKVERRIADNN